MLIREFAVRFYICHLGNVSPSMWNLPILSDVYYPLDLMLHQPCSYHILLPCIISRSDYAAGTP